MTEEEERKARFKLDCVKVAAHDVLAWSALTVDSVFKVAKLIEAHTDTRPMNIFEFKDLVAEVDLAIKKATEKTEQEEVKNDN